MTELERAQALVHGMAEAAEHQRKQVQELEAARAALLREVGNARREADLAQANSDAMERAADEREALCGQAIREAARLREALEAYEDAQALCGAGSGPQIEAMQRAAEEKWDRLRRAALSPAVEGDSKLSANSGPNFMDQEEWAALPAAPVDAPDTPHNRKLEAGVQEALAALYTNKPPGGEG